MASTNGIEITFGTAFFGYPQTFWAQSDSNILEGFKILKKHGVNRLDTAHLYQGSEEKLGSLQAGAAQGFIIDTKWLGGFSKDPNTNTRAAVLASAQRSLSTLGVKQIDVFYIHAPAYDSSLQDLLAGVNDAYEAGIYRRLGLSNFPPSEVQKVFDIAKENGFVLPTVYQGNYSAVARKQEDELFPLLRKLGVSFYAYSPIAGGFLTKTREQINSGVSRFGKDAMTGIYHKLYVKDSFLDALDEWVRIAKDEGLSQAELAYRWIVYHSALSAEYRDGVVIGAGNLDQLEKTLTYSENGPLSETAVEKIDAIWERIKGDADVDNFEAFSADTA